MAETVEESVYYERQQLHALHDWLLAYKAQGGRDQIVVNAFTEAFLIHYRNMLDFLASRGGDDDIKASDFAADFKSSKAPEEYRDRINKSVSHLSRTRSQYEGASKVWHFTQMLDQMDAAWEEFVTVLRPEE